MAFEFLILTATRTSELLHAVPDEIDLAGEKWVIPTKRMKSNREFSVPLSMRCLDILDEAKDIPGDYIFPGRTNTQPLSNMTFLMALRRMGVAATAHGFRSTFRDWAAERTSFSNEVCEMALAHAIEDKTEAAYRRGDLFDKRDN